jgi:transposase
MSILEIIRLNEQGLTSREVAAGANCGKTTVNEVLKRCREAELTYEEASGMTNSAIHARLYSSSSTPVTTEEPEWKRVEAWMKGGKRRNLRYAWEEYRTGKPEGLGYSQFCKRYGQWQEATGRTVTMVQNHEPGKEVFVDWMGDTLDCVSDPVSGQIHTAHFFVAALGYSDYPYVEAFGDETTESWLSANIHMLEYYGGVPRIIVPDNCKTAVSKPNYYDPTINPAYAELARHYNVGIIPARVRKPKDKSLVEGSVGWLETWLVEWLRGQKFFSFEELNREIIRRVKKLADRPFEARSGSRASEFEAADKPALRPLPKTRYEWPTYVTRRVPDNCHVEFEGYYYSVPYTLYKTEVTLRATSTAVEIVNANRERVALHVRRSSGRSRYVTDKAHLTDKHRAQLENSGRTGRDYIAWAATIGVNTQRVIERMLAAQQIEETAYKGCMGVMQGAKKYSPEKLEAACAQALRMSSPCYTTVINLLKNPPVKDKPQPLPVHENLRDPAEFA